MAMKNCCNDGNAINTPKWNTQTSTVYCMLWVSGSFRFSLVKRRAKSFLSLDNGRPHQRIMLLMVAKQEHKCNLSLALAHSLYRRFVGSAHTNCLYAQIFFQHTQNCKSICYIVTWLVNVSFCGFRIQLKSRLKWVRERKWVCVLLHFCLVVPLSVIYSRCVACL